MSKHYTSTKFLKYLFVCLAICLISGCARHFSPNATTEPYGFFSGLWHGFLFPFSITANIVSWLCSLVGLEFLKDIQIIGRPNTGFFYYFGFVFTLLGYGGAGSR